MRIVRPSKLWSLDKGVTGTAPVATFPLSYLTDGIPGTPARWDATGCNFTVTGSAQMVDTLVLANSTLSGSATAVVSGDISDSFPITAARDSGIPLSYLILLDTPVSVDSLTVTIAGASNPVIVGEFLAGLSEQWDLLAESNQWEYNYKNVDFSGSLDMSSVPPHDIGVEWFTGGGSNYADKTELEFLWNWVGGTRGNTKPSIVIPNEEDGYALVCRMDLKVSHSQKIGTPRLNMASISFVEHERSRW